MQSTLTPTLDSQAQQTSRARKLQLLGILSGFTAGAWLGAAEAPTKLVSIGLSPMVISLIMVVGVFLARWSVPALILGTSSVRADVRRAPHLIIWALLAGCLWAVANTMTIFAIRDIGLSIAFPLWNANSLLGIWLTFAPAGLYAPYLHPADSLHIAALLHTGWGLTPALDQEVGGLLMWVAGGFVFLAVMVVLFLQWFGMAETDGVAPAAASF